MLQSRFQTRLVLAVEKIQFPFQLLRVKMAEETKEEEVGYFKAYKMLTKSGICIQLGSFYKGWSESQLCINVEIETGDESCKTALATSFRLYYVDTEGKEYKPISAFVPVDTTVAKSRAERSLAFVPDINGQVFVLMTKSLANLYSKGLVRFRAIRGQLLRYNQDGTVQEPVIKYSPSYKKYNALWDAHVSSHPLII